MTDDQQNENAAGTEGGDGGESGNGFKPITTQEDLNAALKARLDRERAKFADYNDLKTKAAEYDKTVQASKTEAEKTAERMAALEQELNATKSAAMRARIQAKHGISDEDAELFLTATDEETLGKQAERLASREADRRKNNNRVPQEGRTTSPASDADEREFVGSLFGGD